MIVFVRGHTDCFERSLTIGHITGSAWVLNSDGTRALLTHHRKLRKWVQLGGHADGNTDILQVALIEAREESGNPGIEPVSREIFDVDVHLIPARTGEPAHYHHDVRFLFQVKGDDSFQASDESLQLAWVSAAELPRMVVDESVLRMYRKWIRLARVLDDGSLFDAR